MHRLPTWNLAPGMSGSCRVPVNSRHASTIFSGGPRATDTQCPSVSSCRKKRHLCTVSNCSIVMLQHTTRVKGIQRKLLFYWLQAVKRKIPRDFCTKPAKTCSAHICRHEHNITRCDNLPAIVKNWVVSMTITLFVACPQSTRWRCRCGCRPQNGTLPWTGQSPAHPPELSPKPAHYQDPEQLLICVFLATSLWLRALHSALRVVLEEHMLQTARVWRVSGVAKLQAHLFEAPQPPEHCLLCLVSAASIVDGGPLHKSSPWASSESFLLP